MTSIPYRIFTSQYVQSGTPSPSSTCETSDYLVSARFQLTTMTSADFSVCNSYSPRSPQVRTYFPSRVGFTQYPLDLLHKCLMVSHPLDVSMMCHLIRRGRLVLYSLLSSRPATRSCSLEPGFAVLLPSGTPSQCISHD